MITTLEMVGCVHEDHVWFKSDGPEKMTPFMQTVIKQIGQDAGGGRECIERMSRIQSKRSSGLDCSECLFTLELPRGLIAQIQYDAADAQHVFYDLEVTDDVEWAAEFVTSVFSHLKRRGFDRLADDTFRERQNMRAKFQEWSDKYGVEIHLLGSHLKWTEFQRYTGNTPHLFLVSALGNSLLPERLQFHVANSNPTDPELKGVLDDLLRTKQKLRSLRQRGADGTIDLMAIKALENDGCVETRLRNWMNREALGMKQIDSYIREFGRHVEIDKMQHGQPEIRFHGSQIRISGLHLPNTALEAAIGKSITRIVQHPYLTSDMIVLSARNHDHPEQHVELEVKQPTYFFCSLSGQVWE